MSSLVILRARLGTVVDRRAGAAASLVCVAIVSMLVLSATAVASTTSVPISQAPDLEWGVKQSWRTYVGLPESTSGGASVVPASGSSPYQIGWKFDTGTYDPADQTTVLHYDGTVHWTKYPGTQFPGLKPPSYEGPMDVNILDVTISDPVVTIAATESTISADVSSRSMDSWEIENLAGARLVDLDVGGLAPVLAGGTTTWTDIPTASGPDAPAAFAGNYREGTAFDSLSFAYTGPGGAPDVSESWDEPGSSPLALDANEILTSDGLNSQFKPYLLDREGRLVYFVEKAPTAGKRLFRAYGLDEAATLGAPLEILNSGPDNPTKPMFYDSNTGRLFFEATGGQVRWMKYDRGDEQWLQGVVEQPFPLAGSRNLMWDSVGRRAFNFALHVPEGVGATDYDHQQWQLNTYKEQADGSWARQTYDVPNGPAGLNKERYPLTSPLNEPVGLAAPDGSLIVLGTPQSSSTSGVTKPAKVPGAYRITLDEADGTADVEAIAGTEVDNDNGASTFSEVLAGQADQVVLAKEDIGNLAAKVQVVTIPGDGSPAVAEPLVTLPGLETAGPTGFAVDREDGTVWIGGNWSQRIVGVRDGRVIDNQYFPERHPRGGPVMVGEDHAVYAQTNDGSPAGFGGSAFYGMGRFQRLGISPGVTLDPASQQVSLGVGEDPRLIALRSEASGEPDPARQWQVRAPGAPRFADLAGESGETLTVTAAPGMDGTEYRAVYENAAGRIASEPATLSVAYAPRIVTDLGNVTATEGQAATFSLSAQGNPEPEVSWQRRVGGFWQPIAAGDDNFAINGASLTVLATDVEQSGALFRAKLANAAGTVYSRAAKLTVTAPTTIPPAGLDLENVTLAWTGNAEMQKNSPAGSPNYFSAGVSTGTEGTYKSVDGNAAVYQASPSGAETLATWATRGAHVAAGGKQLVRLYGGKARIEPDGATSVRWHGSWSVNFYGGLVPFTFSDPELTVAADGAGTLKAAMSGCAANMLNPDACTPFSTVPGVTVATFSDVEVEPAGEVEIKPDYAGVEVDGDPAKPQVRTGPGWGAWPQNFVSFQVQTGLAPYWYTSGGFDADKAPSPFLVDFQGAAPPSPPPATQAGDSGTGDGQQPAASPSPAASPGPGTSQAVRVAAYPRTQKLGAGRVARLAKLSCAKGSACGLSAPRRLRLAISGRRYGVAVLAPKRIGPGRRASLRLRLSKPAMRALAGRRRPTTVRLRVRSGGQAFELWAVLRRGRDGKVRVLHTGARKLGAPTSAGGAPGAAGNPQSAPIANEPPLLQRPPTAVDVSAVRLTWYPRDSWLRYAASGVAPGDGISLSGGATATPSTASACPDRPSSSDAKLPYAIEFTPKAGWYDPASGVAGIYGQGAVAFRWKAHTIDLTAADPEIEINGPASRAIFRFQGSGGTPYPNQRAALVSLDTAARPSVSNGGRTLTYELMRGTLTADGVNVFAGFYTPPDNDEFGCVSVSFTTP